MKRIFYLVIIFTTLLMGACKKDEPSGKTETTIEDPTLRSVGLSDAEQQILDKLRNFEKSLVENACLSGNEKGENVVVLPTEMEFLLLNIAQTGDNPTILEMESVLGADLTSLESFLKYIISGLHPDTNIPRPAFSGIMNMLNLLVLDNRYVVNDEVSLDFWQNGISFSASAPLSHSGIPAGLNAYMKDFFKTDVTLLKTPFSSTDRMFAVSALQGRFNSYYPIQLRSQRKFHNADGTETTMFMPHSNIKCYYSQDENGGQLVSVPMGTGNVRLNFYLPSEGETMDRALASSALADLLNPGEGLTECTVNYPQFEKPIVTEGLQTAIKATGIERLFTQDNPLVNLGGAGLDAYSTAFNLVVENRIEKDPSTGEADTKANDTGGITITIDRPFLFSITAWKENVVMAAGMINNF